MSKSQSIFSDFESLEKPEIGFGMLNLVLKYKDTYHWHKMCAQTINIADLLLIMTVFSIIFSKLGIALSKK